MPFKFCEMNPQSNGKLRCPNEKFVREVQCIRVFTGVSRNNPAMEMGVISPTAALLGLCYDI